MSAGEVTLRLTIGDPVSDVTYSLQEKKNQPVGEQVAGQRRCGSACGTVRLSGPWVPP